MNKKKVLKSEKENIVEENSEENIDGSLTSDLNSENINQMLVEYKDFIEALKIVYKTFDTE
jgi:hypothetical protein